MISGKGKAAPRRGALHSSGPYDGEAIVRAGAQAIILGCTEIGLLVGAADSSVPLFDTTRIHALAAVEWALAGPPL